MHSGTGNQDKVKAAWQGGNPSKAAKERGDASSGHLLWGPTVSAHGPGGMSPAQCLTHACSGRLFHTPDHSDQMREPSLGLMLWLLGMRYLFSFGRLSPQSYSRSLGDYMGKAYLRMNPT